jgi:hypothetical protein
MAQLDATDASGSNQAAGGNGKPGELFTDNATVSSPNMLRPAPRTTNSRWYCKGR